MPRHPQSRGFDLQRGVEQEPGATKKHLNTREFKQQQREESALVERLQYYERQAQEIIERQKKALAAKSIISAQTEKQQKEINTLHGTVNTLNKKVAHLEAANAEEAERYSASLQRWYKRIRERGRPVGKYRKIFPLESEGQ